MAPEVLKLDTKDAGQRFANFVKLQMFIRAQLQGPQAEGAPGANCCLRWAHQVGPIGRLCAPVSRPPETRWAAARWRWSRARARFIGAAQFVLASWGRLRNTKQQNGKHEAPKLGRVAPIGQTGRPIEWLRVLAGQ